MSINSPASSDIRRVHYRREPAPRRAVAPGIAYWLVAAALLINMAMAAVPSPIYVLYQRRDNLSDITVTVVYAVYAVGVIACLFLGGHLSDRFGRRPVLLSALLLSLVSAVVFFFAPGLTGLITARVISGVAVGLTSATATAYLTDLYRMARPGADSRRSEIVATAANLGGIGFGPLAAGFLIQFAPAPLQLPYVVFAIVLVLLTVAIWLSPETVTPPSPLPAYHTQRITVPRSQRGQFFAATLAGLAAFAVYGLINSLLPAFLADTVHQSSHALAGSLEFAALAAGAAAQIALARLAPRSLLLLGVPVVTAGLGLLTAGMWDAGLPAFAAGCVIAGAGLVFKGALSAASATAAAANRAEVLAGYFLGAYIGVSVPVMGLGVATTYFPPRDAMVVFVAIVVAAITCSVWAVAARTRAGR